MATSLPEIPANAEPLLPVPEHPLYQVEQQQ
jgi:hypothetical protein